MGLGMSQEGQAQQLYQFKKLPSEQENFEIPERPDNRRPTDRKYLITLYVFLVVLIPFLIYTLMYTELGQLYGSDNCGNFCGYKNKKIEEWSCTGKDYTNEKYQLLGSYDINTMIRERQCVAECPSNTVKKFHTCFPKSSNGRADPDLTMDQVFYFLSEVGHDLVKGWWAVVLSTIVSGLLCFGAMSLFRYAVDFVVWFILLGSIGMLAILAGIFWFAYFQMTNQPNANSSHEIEQGASAYLTLAIVVTTIVVVLLLLIACMVKRIGLIIALFKEASKSIFDIPSLILTPVWTSMAVCILFVAFVVLTTFMLLAGKLKQVGDKDHLEYTWDVPMIIAMIYNLISYLWLSEFFIGAQYMLVAGAVSSWFFTRNKNYLNSPVWTSFTNITNFHMGTLAIGSLIITLMAIIKALIKSLATNHRTRWLIDCCLRDIEQFLKFLSKNAYIETAMHGQPFFKSGKRAAKLLVSNAVNVIALNSIGDFVLGMSQLLLIIACGLGGVATAKLTGFENYWAVAVVSVFIGVCMSVTYFSIFKATIDCLFICFCEDTSLNDGMARPYFMSKGLMQFIEDSKSVMPKKN